jgi:uncharacterized protein with LGFP repeats
LIFKTHPVKTKNRRGTINPPVKVADNEDTAGTKNRSVKAFLLHQEHPGLKDNYNPLFGRIKKVSDQKKFS